MDLSHARFIAALSVLSGGCAAQAKPQAPTAESAAPAISGGAVGFVDLGDVCRAKRRAVCVMCGGTPEQFEQTYDDIVGKCLVSFGEPASLARAVREGLALPRELRAMCRAHVAHTSTNVHLSDAERAEALRRCLEDNAPAK